MQASPAGRPLFFYERVLMAGGRRAWNVLLAARLSGAVCPDALRAALEEMQSHHPMLQMTVVLSGNRPRFEVPSPIRPIPVRFVERRDDAVWFGEVQTEIDRRFEPRDGPLVRIVCVTSTETSELVVTADHSVCDSRSMLILMREIVEGLSAARLPRPLQTAAACIQDLFPGKPPRRLGILRHAAHAGWILRKATAVRETLRPDRTVPSPYVLRWEMPTAACATLTERCRAERVTAYTALATSFLRAARTVRPASWRNRLLCPVDARSRIPGIGPGTLLGYPDTVRLRLRGGSEDCWRQARTLHRDLAAARSQLDPHKALLTHERLHGLADWFVSLQLHGRPRNDLMFSHIGDAEPARPMGCPRVEPVLAFLSSMPLRGMTAVFSLRDRGTMRFFLVGREDVLPYKHAIMIRGAAMALTAGTL